MLENVDMTEEEDSNFSHIVDALTKAGPGYHVRAFKLWSTDFGLPQRRCRLYFIGINSGIHPQASLDKVEGVLRALRLKRQPPESCTCFFFEQKETVTVTVTKTKTSNE